MPITQFQLPPNFDGQTRLLPLPDLVMFPHNLMPLRVFQNRYSELLEDALRDDQLIALATLLPGCEHSSHVRPPVATTVCIGRITDCVATAAGTYELVLLGLQRAQIEVEIEPLRSFRRAQVRLLNEAVKGPEPQGEAFGVRLANGLQRSLPGAEKPVHHLASGQLSLASLTDVLAFHLPLPTDLKLELLAEANVLARAERLLASLPSSTCAARRKSWFPIDFSNN